MHLTVRALIPLLALLALPAFADGDGSGSGKVQVFWVVAEAQEDSEGGPRTVYFCGRAKLPKDTRVDVFLRRKGNIFNAARALVGKQTPYFRKARTKLGARAGEAVNFGGYIGPMSNMVLGEWDLLFIAKSGGKRHQTVYPLVVGDVSKALDQEAAEAARLAKRIDELEQRYKKARQLFAEYEELESWDRKIEGKWSAAAGPMILALRRMSDQTLAERSKVLAPIFPFVQMVLTQMPLKLKDLILSHQALYKERAGAKSKPKTFDRMAAIGRIDNEIVRHIKLARDRLGARESVTTASFFLDVTKLENLVGELERQQRRGFYAAKFDPALWNGYAASAVRHITVFQRRVERYKKAGQLAKSAPQALAKLDQALGTFGRLVDIFTAELYRKHRTPDNRQRKHDPTLPGGVKNGKQLFKQLRKTVAEIRGVVEAERTETKGKLLAHYKALRNNTLQLFIESDKGQEGFEAYSNALQRRLESNKFPASAESKAYFPGATDQLEILNGVLISIAVEQRELWSLGAEGEMTIRGEKIKYNRRERLGLLVNEYLRALAGLLTAVEHHDLRLTRTTVAWLKKRNYKADDKVRKQLEAMVPDDEK